MSTPRVILAGCGPGYNGLEAYFLIFRTIHLTYF
jgi:hypothetical protein